ncbi:cyclin-dependent kinase-like protein [Reticulomyxa filosa]|uniref:Cyclin-dependent kinase-like protein n=1 Tax=Reticulomyxa filosa TaxID=46433 RepID=X6LYJ1_RETFI|nr:cyclin-dependent kinase-like protein [Reticulomyxa filosa]|eukprot:ETO05800.1 cyclin-dependent kinase-like protein [Reticulomyxa filosa]
MNSENEIRSKSCIYIIETKIGEGAYGIVLKCQNKETKENIAIKKFKDTEEDEHIKKCITREIKILRMLKHENIIAFKDAFRYLKKKSKININEINKIYSLKKILYLVFELMQGNMLELLEKTKNGLESELLKLYSYQLIQAVKYCHHFNIIHRDIKPENLLINVSPQPLLKLCDFGFARIIDNNDNDDNNGNNNNNHQQQSLTDYVATRWYRAPELLLGFKNYNKPIDIWAIGCIVAELIDSQPLFPGESDLDQLFLIRKVLGPLTEQQKELFSKNPRFLGATLPEIANPQTLSRRYQGHKTFHSSLLSLLKGLLEMDETQRLTIEQAHQHPYFKCFQDNPCTTHYSNHSDSISQHLSTFINHHPYHSHSYEGDINSTFKHPNDDHPQNSRKDFTSSKIPMTPPIILNVDKNINNGGNEIIGFGLKDKRKQYIFSAAKESRNIHRFEKKKKNVYVYFLKQLEQNARYKRKYERDKDKTVIAHDDNNDVSNVTENNNNSNNETLLQTCNTNASSFAHKHCPPLPMASCARNSNGNNNIANINSGDLPSMHNIPRKENKHHHFNGNINNSSVHRWNQKNFDDGTFF